MEIMPMNYSHLYKYYKNKRVFLTGHTGFKGSWMLYWLTLMGAHVKGYSLKAVNSEDHFNVIGGFDRCDSIIADILNKPKLVSEILDFQPDYIFHLAAQPLVRFSYDHPAATFEVNAIGTANILDAVRQLNKSCVVVIITTDKVYDNKEWHYPYRENDRLGGYDPYSASKACAELIISSYRNSFFDEIQYSNHQKSISSVRAGNVIGGGDWAKDRIIPDIVKALSKNEIINVRNPNAIRPWQHVLDPIGGYLHLATKMIDDPIKYGDSWNFGPFADDNLTVANLVEMAISVWGHGDYQVLEILNQPHEAGILKLDISKTLNELDWKPTFNSRKAIEITLDWYKAYFVDNTSKTKEQIHQICNL
jgi:CDP-glucose 4,6-dehydratase